MTARERLLWGAASAAVLAYTLLPMLWILSLSFKSPQTVTDRRLWPSDPTLANYRGIFGTSLFSRALLNSVGVALLTTVLAVLVASLAAYAVTRLEFRGKSLVLPLSLAVAVFPPVAVVGPLFDVWRAVRLYDTWPGLVIPYLSFSVPLAMWTLIAFFRGVPWEMEQAAQADGATPWQAFRRVVAAAGPAGRADRVDPGVLLRLERLRLRHLADLLGPVPDGAGGAGVLHRGGAVLPARRQHRGRAVVVTVPVVVAVLVFRRRLVAALTAGVVKG